jgi:hypothetical protein
VIFIALALCVVSQRVLIVFVVYFVINSVRKFFDTPSFVCVYIYTHIHIYSAYISYRQSFSVE